MALSAPRAGLRSVWYNAASAAKVEVVVQPGDELDVSDDVAGQLFRASAQFKPGPAAQVFAPPAAPVPAVSDDDDEADPQPRPRRTRKV